jgi:bifunctional non-homologous end joining protein LigD
MAARQCFEIAGQDVPISNPDKVVFGDLGLTKMDLIRYYASVADGALRGVQDRPRRRSSRSARPRTAPTSSRSPS